MSTQQIVRIGWPPPQSINQTRERVFCGWHSGLATMLASAQAVLAEPKVTASANHKAPAMTALRASAVGLNRPLGRKDRPSSTPRRAVRPVSEGPGNDWWLWVKTNASRTNRCLLVRWEGVLMDGADLGSTPCP